MIVPTIVAMIVLTVARILTSTSTSRSSSTIYTANARPWPFHRVSNLASAIQRVPTDVVTIRVSALPDLE